jgi:hypothetical protein
MNKKQFFAWVILMLCSAYILQNVHNGVFGLLDNGPMLVLMLMGLDPDSWIGTKLAKYSLDPIYVACGVAMLVNTVTDGICRSRRPECLICWSSCWLLGAHCLSSSDLETKK